MIINLEKHLNYLSFMLIIFILSICTGPFLPDLMLSLIGLYFIFLTYKYRLYKFYKNIFSLWFIPLYFLILISGISSQNIFDSLIDYDGPIFYFRYYFFVIAIYFLLISKKNIFKLLNYILIFILLFVGVDALFQFFFGFDFFGIPRLEQGQLRISGIFGKEQILGHYLIKLLPISLVIMFYLKIANQNKFLIYFYVLFLSSIIFISGDRTAMLILFMIGMSFFFIDLKQNILNKLIYLFSIISIFFIIIFLNPSSQQRFNQTLSEVSSISIPFLPFSPGHERLIMNGLDLAKSDFLFGIGTQMYRSTCSLYQSYCATHPHNIYVQIFIENGLIGILLLLIPFIYFAIYCLHTFFINLIKKNSLNQKSYHFQFIIILIACNLWPIMPYANFYNNWMNCLLYLPIPFWLFFHNQKQD